MSWAPSWMLQPFMVLAAKLLVNFGFGKMVNKYNYMRLYVYVPLLYRDQQRFLYASFLTRMILEEFWCFSCYILYKMAWFSRFKLWKDMTFLKNFTIPKCLLKIIQIYHTNYLNLVEQLDVQHSCGLEWLSNETSLHSNILCFTFC